jgi:uncharacterized protein YozE (UPF0346 family)
MKPPTFRTWLAKYRELRTPVGDFARDARSDPAFPVEPLTWERLLSYLWSVNACQGALEAAEAAWLHYVAETEGGHDH